MTILKRFIKPSLTITTILNLNAMDGIIIINGKAKFDNTNYENEIDNGTEKEHIENIDIKNTHDDNTKNRNKK